MPGYAAALTTVATAKTELGITASTDDDYLTYLVRVTSDHIAGRCNRNFTYSASWAEFVPSYGQNRLIVTHTPVIAINSILYNGAEIDAANYSVADPGKGWVFNRSGWTQAASLHAGISDVYAAGTESNAYAITYAGGYVTPQQALDLAVTRTLPYDLEHACVQATVSLYRSRGQDRRINQESLLSYSAGYGNAVDELPEVTSVIRRYRRIGTGR